MKTKKVILIYNRGLETIIECECGHMDKAYSHLGKANAEQHNNSIHRGGYSVVDMRKAVKK